MGRPKGKIVVSDEQIISALNDCWGNVTWASEKLGYKYPGNMLRRIQNNPTLTEARNKALKLGIDRATNIILQYMMQDGYSKEKLDAAKYFLSHMGRNEGWGESKDVNVTETVKFDFDKLPLDERIKIRDAMLKAREELDGEITGTGSLNPTGKFYSEN